MLNLGMKKEFMKIYLYALIFNLIISFVVVPHYLAFGTSIILISTELFVFFSMYFILNKYLKKDATN